MHSDRSRSPVRPSAARMLPSVTAGRARVSVGVWGVACVRIVCALVSVRRGRGSARVCVVNSSQSGRRATRDATGQMRS